MNRAAESRPAATDPAAHIDQIRAEQIKSVYRGTMPGLLGSLIAAVILASLLVYLGSVSTLVAGIFVASIVEHQRRHI